MRLGVIGYGGRIRGVIDMVQRIEPNAAVVAITDVRNDALRGEIAAAGGDPGAIAFYSDPDEMLDRERLDGVMVGTRCSLHARMAIKALARNLPIYLEKPVATNMEDLLALRAAATRSTSPVVVSFPLRVTPLVRAAGEIIASGQIGTVEQVQAWNNVPYGWCYFQSWYRDENETGGLFLQKATHDFDYINHLLGNRPTRVCAMTAKRIMRGDRPPGLRCDDCGEHDTCLESPYHLYFTKAERPRVQPSGLQCCFATDTGNEDSGSALIEYESGMHVSYTQNFYARKAAGKRGATLLGYKGTVEFDWYTDEVKVIMHHSPRVDRIKFDTSGAGHGGGDTVLADNFVRVVRGERPSVAPLEAGLLSVLMCLEARESARTHTFRDIGWPT